ncbi:hypothetical protein IE53DRAFT_249474 [Violaceomyces palustris]|uniref:Uncharacterized protein n=1 Tax=Violaceomyces palustris TaxID=1673888 RepID=A0ACD0NNN0_9BASI|nr:hypothetical protein IE53DRAFT_249474 [Violaceomyces palustris]
MITANTYSLLSSLTNSSIDRAGKREKKEKATIKTLPNHKFIPESRRGVGWSSKKRRGRKRSIHTNTALVVLVKVKDGAERILIHQHLRPDPESNPSVPSTLRHKEPNLESSSQDQADNDDADDDQRIDYRNIPTNPSSSSHHHPDDLIFPIAYPWKPIYDGEQARTTPPPPSHPCQGRVGGGEPGYPPPPGAHVSPSHRNPSAKQAIYDTHFGSSSGYLRRVRRVIGRKGRKGGELRFPTLRSVKRRFGSQTPVSGQRREEEAVVVGELEPPSTADDDDDEGSHSEISLAEVGAHSGEGDDRPGGARGRSKTTSLSLHLTSRLKLFSALANLVSFLPSLPTMRTAQHVTPSSRPLSVSSSSSSSSSASASPSLMTSAPNPGTSLAPPNKVVWATEPELIPTIRRNHDDLVLGETVGEEEEEEEEEPDYFENLEGNLLIMGGYRGSTLRDVKTKDEVWIPIKVGVGMRKPKLELGLSQKDEEEVETSTVATDMVTHIGKLVDMGKRLTERASARQDLRVVTWGYDWRLSLEVSSRKLIQKLTQLREESQGRRGTKVVAHSMGGLVALHALATCEDPRIFEGIVFASTPFEGTPNILGPLRFGDAALLNDTICSPRATFSFRSSFYLLPRGERGCFEIDSSDGDDSDDSHGRVAKLIKIDFLDPAQWDKYGFSPCIPQPSSNKTERIEEEEEEEQAKRYLQRTLSQVERFHQEIRQGFDARKSASGLYPPLMILTSGRTPTVRGALVGKDWKRTLREGDYSRMTYAPGDGIVTRTSSTALPTPWNQLLVDRTEISSSSPSTKGKIRLQGRGVIESNHRHISLLSDVRNVAIALESIQRSRIHRARNPTSPALATRTTVP